MYRVTASSQFLTPFPRLTLRGQKTGQPDWRPWKIDDMGVSSILMPDDKMVGNTYPRFVSVRNISRSRWFYNQLYAMVFQGGPTDLWPGPDELTSWEGRDAYSEDTGCCLWWAKSWQALAWRELSQVPTWQVEKRDVPMKGVANLYWVFWWKCPKCPGSITGSVVAKLNQEKGPPCGEEGAKPTI